MTYQPPTLWQQLLGSVNAKWEVSTLGEVAEFFGLARQTVKQWRLESPPMPGEPGRFNLSDVAQWRHAKSTTSDINRKKKEQDYELTQLQIEQKQLELAREKSTIVDRQDVELWASTALVEIREAIMQLPEMLVAASPPEIKDYVRKEADRHCRSVLKMARQRLEKMEIAE